MLDGDDEGVILALCQSDVSQRTAKADVSGSIVSCHITQSSCLFSFNV